MRCLENKEIGSSFSSVELRTDISNDLSSITFFSFSGRTALQSIIDDILSYSKVKRAALPLYCCESMIIPFLKRNIEVVFYDVGFNNGVVSYCEDFEDVDIILTMNYFGVNLKNTRDFEVSIRKSRPNAVIIKDCTHSLFSEETREDIYDYCFASIRKWSGFADGGIIFGKKKILNQSQRVKSGEYLDNILKAMKLKNEYLKKGIGDKEAFLKLYEKAEHDLDVDYENIEMSDYSKNALKCFDIDNMKELRRSNYIFLHSQIKQCDTNIIQPVFSHLEDREIPLFFPVVLPNREVRDKFRKYLIENRIYCPLHWPISNNISDCKIKANSIYNRELSIICDQRYGIDDMKKIVEIIRSFTRR